MAFTTLQGASASDATSFIGSAGVDSVNLNNVGTTVWLGAQGANDIISFESSTRSVSGYTLRGGQGQDRLSVSDGATSLTNSFINLNNDNDVLELLSVSSSTIYGGGGSDTLLTGDLRSVRFNGNKGDDTLTFSNNGSLTSTTVNGNEGNDTINVNAISSFSDSTLFGGQGNDSINAASSNVGVLAFGNTGTDTLSGGSGNDSLTGGSGADQLTGGLGVDSFQIDTDTDTITDLGNGGNDELDIAANATANATVVAAFTAQTNSSNAGTLNATAATNLAAFSLISFAGITGNGVTLTGNSFGLNLFGSAQADTINGGGAVDTINGLAGNDQLSGGAFDDRFEITAGIDTITDLNNNDANDVLVISAGATANATVIGAGFVNRWIASNLTSNDGTANITVSDGSDGVDLTQAIGSAGYTVNAGNNGDDNIGSGFADTLNGGLGTDSLNGGLGNDSITGGVANDEITLGNGNDSLIFYGGEAGVGGLATAAQVEANLGKDTIQDYSVADDTIVLSGLSLGAINPISAANFFSAALQTTVVNIDFSAAGVGGGLVYDQTNGNLIYTTANMTNAASDTIAELSFAGGGQNATIIGTFAGIPALAASEFILVI